MARGLHRDLDLNGLAKLAQEVSALQEKAHHVDELRAENERLRHQLSQLPKGWTELLNDNHVKQAKIEALEERLKTAQMRIHRWRRKFVLSSSPTGSEDTRPHAAAKRHLPPDGVDADSPPLSRESPIIVAEKPVKKEPGRSANTSPLQETCGNVVKPRLTRKRKAGDHSADAIQLLAEDGEDYERVKTEHENKIAKTAAHRRVADLLSGPTPSLPVLKASNANATHTTTSSGNTSRFLPLKRPTSDHETSRRPASFLPPRTSTAAGAEDLEPLRARPLHRLGLSHFKLNSKNNDGLDYAYSDVVRDRQQRKCLSGCTRPDCCGSTFEVLAAGIDLQISEDDLLKDFLGPNQGEKIRNLTPMARKNLIEEARTKLTANLYGKHRNLHERAQSPPGFWRTEMPGTQEELQDREKARMKEREEIERRYTEACRGSGMWTFADE